jgi:uncharacterized protein YndB with AHSA1/START domain
MIAEPIPRADAARLERTYDVPAEVIWELWTTRPASGTTMHQS